MASATVSRARCPRWPPPFAPGSRRSRLEPRRRPAAPDDVMIRERGRPDDALSGRVRSRRRRVSGRGSLPRSAPCSTRPPSRSSSGTSAATPSPRRSCCWTRSCGARHLREGVPRIMSARILIVDDTPANIQMLMAILREEGYQLSAATNGRQAIEVIEKVRPDLVLMDVVMPEMDGYEACRADQGLGALARSANHLSDCQDRDRPTSCAASKWARSTTWASRSTATNCWRASAPTSRCSACVARWRIRNADARPRAGSRAGNADRRTATRRRRAARRQPGDPRAARIDQPPRRRRGAACC